MILGPQPRSIGSNDHFVARKLRYRKRAFQHFRPILLFKILQKILKQATQKRHCHVPMMNQAANMELEVNHTFSVAEPHA